MREKLCDDQNGHRLAIYGLGGVGKTQLAIEYVFSYKHEYNGIYWISAVNKAEILSGLRDIAQATSCLGTDSLKPDDVPNAVLQWLRKQNKWLLVLDNLDDISAVMGNLPELPCEGHVLITTRDQSSIRPLAEPFEIDVLDRSEATDLLLLRADLVVGDTIPGSGNIKVEASKIAIELGFLPLAIEQAASFIREKLKDIFLFIPLYKDVQVRRRLLQHRPLVNSN